VSRIVGVAEGERRRCFGKGGIPKSTETVGAERIAKEKGGGLEHGASHNLESKEETGAGSPQDQDLARERFRMRERTAYRRKKLQNLYTWGGRKWKGCETPEI